jgi:hypothetical protein
MHFKYIATVMEPINEAQNNGGIILQVGTGMNAVVRKFYPLLMHLVADNQGAHCCMGCKTGGTQYPCRWCINNQTECLFDMPTKLRNDKEALTAQKKAWVAFCKSVRGIFLNADDKDSLKYCENNSIQPLICTLLTLKTPYPTHNAYTYAPPDSLHTLIAGLMKAWILWSMTIIERVGMYGVYYCS